MSPIAAAALQFFALLGCASQPEQPADLQSTVGWLHGNCLAIRNLNLSPGQFITIVTLGAPKTQLEGRVQGRAVDAQSCYPLEQERREVNQDADYTFYRVASSSEPSLGIGLLPSARNHLLSSQPESLQRFSYCSSSEGIHFSVWRGEPYESERLWTAYYYLGYDIEATCPE